MHVRNDKEVEEMAGLIVAALKAWQDESLKQGKFPTLGGMTSLIAGVLNNLFYGDELEVTDYV